MSTWTKQKLQDCVTFRTGKLNSSAAVINGTYPFFTCSQVIYKTNTWGFDTECVLLGGNNASAVYPIFYFKGKFDAYQRTYIIEPKNDNNIRYFYYLLREKLGELRKQSTGATTKFLTLKILHNIVVFIPDYLAQQDIAAILSAYDDLIENNEKRIKILEEMAERLYREWFVKFKFPGHEKVRLIDSNTEYGKIPEGWEVKRLGDKIQVKKGKNITKNTIIEGDIPVVAGGISPAYFHNIPNTRWPVVTVSASGANAGFTRLYFQNIWASDCSYIDSNMNKQVYYFYLFLKNKQKEISRLQRGSAQPHVYPKDLMNLCMVDVPSKTLENFSKIISPVFDLIGKLNTKNDNLSKTRDLLIPQLVTGKREVKI